MCGSSPADSRRLRVRLHLQRSRRHAPAHSQPASPELDRVGQAHRPVGRHRWCDHGRPHHAWHVVVAGRGGVRAPDARALRRRRRRVACATNRWRLDHAKDLRQTLEIAWQYDCCPSDYRVRDGQPIPYARWNKNSPDGPSEIISTPIVHNGRDLCGHRPEPDSRTGTGGVCRASTRATGARVWESRQVEPHNHRCVIHEGLVFIADYSGLLALPRR